MTDMVTKANETKPREYSGVHFELLAVGEQTMVTKMHFEAGNEVHPHDHPNEQSGYVLSGRHRLIIDGVDTVVEAGDSYSIPRGVEHAVEVLESGEVIDVFVPPREDYR